MPFPLIHRPPPRLISPRTWLCGLLLALATASAWPGEASLSWFAGGQPRPEAARALAVLEAAGEQGLDPRDYQAGALRDALRRVQQDPSAAPERQRRLDAAVTAALVRYLGDLQRGRVDPHAVHARFHAPRRPMQDPHTLLREALAGHRVEAALREAEPDMPMYASLREALARYRALAQDPAWDQALRLPGRTLAPGQPYEQLAILARRLQALGDLPPEASLPPRYEGELVTALRTFQERHGLEVDGLLGPATLRELNVTPAARAQQIALAMERLRWTPVLQGPRMIVVNIPEFVLRAYEVEGARVKVRLSMNVIVGKALDTRTPLMDEPMRFIEFSPYWNVPASIARQEIVPRLRREPDYFDREGFEFVTGSGQVVDTLSADGLDAVLDGRWRIRQRPGPKNALGDIKFVFPNDQNIYLHHTPTPQLFGRERRDFSHGCIRVEQPLELAKFVLADAPAWSEDRIREAMDAGSSRTIALPQPLPVLIAYSTVVAKGGRLYFYPDLYGHDAQLAVALRAHAARLAPLLGPLP